MTLHDRPADFRIAVAMIINAHGEMLTVRKRGSSYFQQPGGKIDNGETPLEALMRELMEELALDLSQAAFRYEGTFREMAANEPGLIVEAEAFSLFAAPRFRTQAEIEEARWLPVTGRIDVLRAALTEHYLFPLAARRFAEFREQKA
ncbi:NUDIX domain-containing protein [Martelella sp. HB161492]|uniref:NUDIX hydrolase n=1 Tax=Martelella sp. HB161492 TaxID=2720726 RepID=UPI0015909CE1|nr:NUDIX domain-containing protein [Martelella sp. HB161492]